MKLQMLISQPFSARFRPITTPPPSFDRAVFDSSLHTKHRNDTTSLKKFITTTTLIMLASLSTLTGCWSSKDPSLDPEPVELRSESAALSTEVPEAELANLSKRLYQSSMYTVARDSLNSLKDRYPLGPYATLAELKYADSFFYNGEYSEAAVQYEAFAKNHPESPEALYSKLQAARSHASSAKTDGRDRSPWERSLALYNELAKSDSELARTARLERASVIAELKAYDREIMAFYKKTDNQAAVAAREAAFKKRWASEYNIPTHTVESNLFATLGSTKPKIELAPLVRPKPLQDADSTPMDASAHTTADPDAEIISIACSDSPVRYIIVELTTLPTRVKDLLGKDELLHPQSGRIVLPGLSFASQISTWTCSDPNNAQLDTEGRLSVPSEVDLLLSVIETPPRLVLSPNVQ